ncbi:MAG: BON domain-containing protein [Steroidobacteraceae bacterium]
MHCMALCLCVGLRATEQRLTGSTCLNTGRICARRARGSTGCERSKRRAQKDSNSMSVSVKGGDVTLSGSVHNWSDRDLATHTAPGTPGVCSVGNNTTLTY